ncbi:MAG: XRE family transcriptional regulator [Clostridia bacterium]|nr:XRE family transcriptional regulator [Clostridia bacterium]
MFDNVILAKKIKSFRLAKGLTQKELAAKLYLRAQSVSKWERALAVPDVEKIYEMSRIFEVSISDILGEIDDDKIWMIGVDGGATKTEIVLFDSNGTIAKKLILEGTNPNVCGMERCLSVLRSGIDEMLRVRPNVKGCFIGAAGLGTGDNAALVKDALSGNYSNLKIKCVSDMYNGTVFAKGDGRYICSICGTGGVVFVYEKGEITRLGGYGVFFDKAGSGYDVGREAFLTALEERDGIGEKSIITEMVEAKAGGRIFEKIPEIYSKEPSYVASFAPIVFEAYEKGDAVAERIITENADRLAFLINRAHEIYAPVEKTLILSGSLYRNRVFLEAVKKRLKYDFDVFLSDYPPVYGACVMCCRLCGADETKIAENFRAEYAKTNTEDEKNA